MGVFEISGKAEKFVNYDIAVISIAFFEDAKTSSSASKAVMKECEKFLEKLDKEGINIKDITLDNDSVSKEKYSDKQQVNASREVALRIPFNMEVINRIRQIADENEYSIEYDIDYELSNESQIREELLKEALLDSKKKAELLAASLDLKVIGIESLAKGSTRYYGISDLCEQERVGSVRAPEFLLSNQLKSKEEKLSETIDVKWNIG